MVILLLEVSVTLAEEPPTLPAPPMLATALMAAAPPADAFSDAGIDLVGGASAHQQQAAMRKAGGGQQLDNFTHPALKSRSLDRRLYRPLRGGIGRLGPGAERAIRAGKHHERSDRFGHIGQIGNGEHENPFRFEQAF